jgi:hypothetical protein
MYVLDSCETRIIDGRMVWCAIHADDNGNTFVWRSDRFVRVERCGSSPRDVGHPITRWTTAD